MTRLLAVSDETEEALWRPEVRRLQPDLVVACGDLPYDYLEFLTTVLDVPLVFVPGNHDPERPAHDTVWHGLTLRSGLPTEDPRPRGCLNADGRVLDVAGLRLAGLGGCVRYRPGPHQYSQAQFRRRARRLDSAAARHRRRDGRGVDVLLTHAPPRHLGDADDPPHHGIEALHRLVPTMRPRLLLHGHIHPYGRPQPDRALVGTAVYNVIPHRIIELDLNRHKDRQEGRADARREG